MYEAPFWDYLRTAVATHVGLSDFVSDVMGRDDRTSASGRLGAGAANVGSSSSAVAPTAAVTRDVPTEAAPAANDRVAATTSGLSAVAHVDLTATSSPPAAPTAVEPAVEGVQDDTNRVQGDHNLEYQATTLLASTSDVRQSVMGIIDSSRDLVDEDGAVTDS